MFADDGILDELRGCAFIDDASARLACYDKLGGREDPVPAVVSVLPAPPPEELGAELLSRKDEEEKAPVSVVARVTECSMDASQKKYIFYLDGGQVWKQVGNKRLYFNDCDFSVTISKDFFGYKMQREGEKTRFRVSRLR